jgi:uncharacterized membrane protein YjdF
MATTKEILDLDCREEKNKAIIQKVLRQLKPLSKYSEEEEIPLMAIEKVIKIMSSKYYVRIQALVPDIWVNHDLDIWRGEIINEVDYKQKFIYGASIYEVLAKAAILIYSGVKKKEYKERKKK